MAVWLIRSVLRQSAIKSLDPKKVAQEKDIHTNILKQKLDFFAFHVQKDVNVSSSTSNFLII